MSSLQVDRRRGFSLVEVVMSTLILALVMVPALHALGAFIRGQQRNADRSRGILLARELMAEVLEQRYEEPDDEPVFGREAGEAADARGAYDDVDDYDGWTASPPQKRDGTTIGELAAWERSVSVDLVDLNDLNATVVSDQGVKRVTVTVKVGGDVAATLVTVRARSWPDPPFE